MYYSKNPKLQKAYDLVKESILEKVNDFDSYWYETRDDAINELRRYKREFIRELDYNYYAYGNLLIYYTDINKLFKDAWYNRLYGNEELRYKTLVWKAIDDILD